MWNILSNPPHTWVSCFVQEFNGTIYKVHVYPLKELRIVLSYASWSTCRKSGPDGFRDLLNLTHECCRDSELWFQSPCSLPLYLSPAPVGGDPVNQSTGFDWPAVECFSGWWVSFQETNTSPV